MRAFAFGLILACAVAFPAAIAPLSGPPTFTQVTAAPDLAQMGEPGLVIDTAATPNDITVTAPGFGVWGSANDGASWTARAAGPFDGGVGTNGDASQGIDADGVIYLSGLTDSGGLASTIPMQVSLDHGSTWIRTTALDPSAGGIDCDRQWTAARGHGVAVTIANCAQEQAWRTTDAGVTWSGPINIFSVLEAGPLAYAPDGTLDFLYIDNNGAVALAKSHDDGLTWSTSQVTTAAVNNVGFPVVAADAAGNLYAAWDDGQWAGIQINTNVFEATSTDGGAHWSAPLQVSPAGQSALFPWVAAGAAGKVDIAYYTQSGRVKAPDLAPPTTSWDVGLAQSVNALAASPSYQNVVVAAGFHQGSICTTGLACVGPQNLGLDNAPGPFDRRVYDFFEMRLDSAGNAFIAYPKDGALTSHPACIDLCSSVVFTFSDLDVAIQTGGTNLS